MRGRDRLHVPEIDERLGLDQRPGDQVAAQGRDDHGRQGGDGVGADDQLEGVEGAGERRAEAGRDGPGRTAAHQGAQVAAPHLEGDAEPRGEAGGDLCVAGFEPHRGAGPVRDDVLECEVEAVAQGHPAAMQGVRLDRVDGGTLARAADVVGGDDQQAEHAAAQAGAHEEEHRRHGIDGAEARPRGQLVEPLAQGLGDPGHGGDRHAGDAAHQGRQGDEAALAPANEAAQPSGGLDEADPGPTATGPPARPDGRSGRDVGRSVAGRPAPAGARWLSRAHGPPLRLRSVRLAGPTRRPRRRSYSRGRSRCKRARAAGALPARRGGAGRRYPRSRNPVHTSP